MNQATFERYEKKYLLTAAQYRQFRERTRHRLAVDQYGRSTILSVYYDTPDARMIRASMEKPVYKEKLRLRSYGRPGAGDAVFVELKKKYRGIVYKRRVEMPLNAAQAWLGGQGKAPDGQIGREIAYTLARYENLAPAMFIAYDRVALYGKDDPLLRVTFDSRLLFRHEALTLADGAWGEPLLDPAARLMEVKLPGAMPLWLAHLMDELKIYPASFSKYAAAYQRTLCPVRMGGAQSA